MSSVLVLGATGVIGLQVSLEFLANGFIVYGLARSQQKADILAKHEIIPILSENGVKDTSKWVHVAEKVDIIIESILDFGDATFGGDVLTSIKGVLAKYPKKTIIYTSGANLYGSSEELINENSKYNVLDVLAARLKVQEEYIKLGAIVLQPAFVINTIFPLYYQVVKSIDAQGTITIAGSENQYRSYVHVKDVARFYLAVAKRSNEFKGEVFIISGSNEKVKDVLHAIGKAAKVEIKKINFTGPNNLIDTFISTTQRTSSAKGINLLNWFPVQQSFVEGVERYYKSIELTLSNKQ